MTETPPTDPYPRRKLMIVIGSVRPGRQGDQWAAWIADLAREHSNYDVEIVDLAELALPFMDEPNHPRLQQYTHEHTKQWSAMVESTDAFIFVTPEYNYSYPASLKNALDYLFVEWKDKVAGIVSYGGISGGLRSTHHLRQVLGALGLAVPQGTVAIPFSAQYLDENGSVDAPAAAERSAHTMMAEMERVGELMRPR